MNMKTGLWAVAILIGGTFAAGALTLNPGGGFQPVDTHTCTVVSSCSTNVNNITRGKNCASTGYVYYTDYCSNCGATTDPDSGGTPVTSCMKITSCTSCPSGYSLTEKTGTGGGCQSLFSYTYKTCCGACSNCTDSAWTSVSGKTGLQQRTKRTCDCGTCKDSGTEYRCAAGYYGLAVSASSTCTRCPSLGNSAAGAQRVQQCYVTSGSDTTGSYTYESPCYYSSL